MEYSDSATAKSYFCCHSNLLNYFRESLFFFPLKRNKKQFVRCTCLSVLQAEDVYTTQIGCFLQCRRNEIHIWGAAHCYPSHSVHCYKGNILQFENYWGAMPPQPPGFDRPVLPLIAFADGHFTKGNAFFAIFLAFSSFSLIKMDSVKSW